MIIDMHVHTSEYSECAESGIMDYVQTLEDLRRKGRGIDALVITEHGVYVPTSDTERELSARYGILILRGIEVNTDYCHMLIYGMDQDHWNRLEWGGERTLSAREVIDTTLQTEGMAAVPAHPFRACPVGGQRDFSGVSVIEVYNGANNDTQDLRALQLAEELRCLAIGGSDAHRTHQLGKCVTEFETPIHSMVDLVKELKRGKFRALKRSISDGAVLQNSSMG